MQVGTILKSKGSDVVTVGPDETVGEAARKLAENDIGALVVSRDGATADGILSERDIARAVAARGAATATLPVRALMTGLVAHCAPADDIADIMAAMTARRVRHLPVMDRGRMCGIVSIGDAVKARLEEIEQEAAALRDYIVSA